LRWSNESKFGYRELDLSLLNDHSMNWSIENQCEKVHFFDPDQCGGSAAGVLVPSAATSVRKKTRDTPKLAFFPGWSSADQWRWMEIRYMTPHG